MSHPVKTTTPKRPLAELQANAATRQDFASLKATGGKVSSYASGSYKPLDSSNKRALPEETCIPDEDSDVEFYDPKLNCNKVRTNIRALIDGGEMKVTHFQRELGINSNSYGRFMALKGPWAGVDNQTYHQGYKFFKRREIAGVKAPAKKRKSNDGSAKKTDNSELDVSGIHIDGEEDDAVEVYDMPQEIRRKINAHLPRDGVTKAGFVRMLGDMYHPAKKIQSGQLDTFRGYKKVDQGNTSSIYYGAYVYFEKLRIKENKPKTKHRQEMESIWGGKGGFDTQRRGPSSGYLIMGPGESASVSQYGEIIIHRR